MRQLLVQAEKLFKITIPDNAKVTFGPWSPPFRDKNSIYTDPSINNARGGTLRIYQGTRDNIIACFSNVHSFRDLSMDYAEQVAKEEGATIWKDDKDGYVREDKRKIEKEWVHPQIQGVHLPKPKRSKG